MIFFHTMKSTQQMWENRTWPVRNGLYIADGTVALLKVSMPWETSDKRISVIVSGSAKLEQIHELRENRLTHLASLCEESNAGLKLTIFAGEGAHGSEGFVAVSQTTTGHLMWLAYFDCSNPFEKVLLKNGIVTAVSNLGHSWHFPLTQPERLTVDTGK